MVRRHATPSQQGSSHRSHKTKEGETECSGKAWCCHTLITDWLTLFTTPWVRNTAPGVAANKCAMYRPRILPEHLATRRIVAPMSSNSRCHTLQCIDIRRHQQSQQPTWHTASAHVFLFMHTDLQRLFFIAQLLARGWRRYSALQFLVSHSIRQTHTHTRVWDTGN